MSVYTPRKPSRVNSLNKYLEIKQEGLSNGLYHLNTRNSAVGEWNPISKRDHIPLFCPVELLVDRNAICALKKTQCLVKYVLLARIQRLPERGPDK